MATIHPPPVADKHFHCYHKSVKCKFHYVRLQKMWNSCRSIVHNSCAREWQVLSTTVTQGNGKNEIKKKNTQDSKQ